jgi:hypothetical protein
MNDDNKGKTDDRAASIALPVIDAPKRYDENVTQFREGARDCMLISRRVAGRNAGERAYWASVLFTKLTVTSISMLKLLPERKEQDQETPETVSFETAIQSNWDFTAIAALARTLFENSIALFYLCFDSIDEDEWLSRLNLMQLHDFKTRRKTFHQGEPDDGQPASVIEDLHRKLNGRAYFKSLPANKRTEFLRGTKIHFISHEDILKRMGKTGVEGYISYWHWWSSYAHSFPMSYYRMSEQARGSGLQNSQDVLYIAATLEVLNEFVKDSIAGMRIMFPDTQARTALAKAIADQLQKR